MVGTPADGQLVARSARARSGIRFAVASRADDAAIRRLLRENPMRGSVTLTLEREPDYFLGANLGGGEDRVIVAFEGNQLLCMGRCTTRDAWLNGQVRRVGYLAELRLDARAQGRFDVLRGGYRFFQELHETDPADFYFTSIAADNERARRLLERGLPGLPRYEHIGNLTTLLVSTRTSGATRLTLSPIASDELVTFLNATASRNQLSVSWTKERIGALASHDLPIASFGALRKDGAIVAAAGFWDQRRFRQTIVRGYSPALNIARPFINSVGGVFGFRPLPGIGATLSHAFLSPLAIAAGHDALLSDLVAAFCTRAAVHGINYITVALPSRVAGLAALKRRFRCRAYASRLYRVRWPGEPNVAFDDRPLLPDLALL